MSVEAAELARIAPLAGYLSNRHVARLGPLSLDWCGFIIEELCDRQRRGLRVGQGFKVGTESSGSSIENPVSL